MPWGSLSPMAGGSTRRCGAIRVYQGWLMMTAGSSTGWAWSDGRMRVMVRHGAANNVGCGLALPQRFACTVSLFGAGGEFRRLWEAPGEVELLRYWLEPANAMGESHSRPLITISRRSILPNLSRLLLAEEAWSDVSAQSKSGKWENSYPSRLGTLGFPWPQNLSVVCHQYQAFRRASSHPPRPRLLVYINLNEVRQQCYPPSFSEQRPTLLSPGPLCLFCPPTPDLVAPLDTSFALHCRLQSG